MYNIYCVQAFLYGLIYVIRWRGIQAYDLEHQHSECGTAASVEEMDDRILTGRIVGGFDASISAVPWMAYLKGVSFGGSPSGFCGAAIIDNLWLISAAHCKSSVDQAGFTEVLVVVGSDFEQHEQGSPVIHRVKRWYVHPDFVLQYYLNDIAVIELETPLEFMKGKVFPICVPPKNFVPSGKAIVAGFGSIKFGATVTKAPKLQALIINILTRDHCKNMESNGFNETIHICAGFYEGGKDACVGDSGGPLFTKQNGKAYLIGVVSYGVKCAMPEFPGVYTRVTTYVDWIASIVGGGGGGANVSPVSGPVAMSMGATNPLLVGRSYVENLLDKYLTARSAEVNFAADMGRKYDMSCGKAPKIDVSYNAAIFTGRVVDGFNAPITSVPWIVHLKGNQYSGGPLGGFCGASILSPYWVVTAAHCRRAALQAGLQELFALVGTDRSGTGYDGGKLYKVRDFYVHPKFVYKTYQNDIGLIRLHEPIDFEQLSVTPICLPPQGSETNGRALIAGFGATNYETRRTSKTLKALDVNILSPSACGRMRANGFNPRIHICAGYVEGGKDACIGDSGGPLFALNNEQAFLVGIISYGHKCAVPGFPGVYTKVSQYVDWVYSTIEKVEAEQPNF